MSNTIDEISVQQISLFYEESNKTSAVGDIISWFSIIAVTLLAGYLYAVAITVIPVIYLNFVMTIGFGLLLYVTIRVLVRFTHNRNRKSQIIMVVVAGILANYFQWTCYVVYLVTDGMPSFGEYLSTAGWIFSPGDFFRAVSIINETGPWSVFGVAPTGFVLASVWFAEGLIILIIPVLSVWRANAYPYSENLSKWYPKFTLDRDFETVVHELFVPALQADPLQAIQELGKGSALRHGKIHVYYTPDENWQYLTAETISTESKTAVKSGSNVVDSFRISRHQAEEILANFTHKKVRLDLL